LSTRSMSGDSPAVELPDASQVLYAGPGTDGRLYSVRAMSWTLENIEKYWEKFRPYKILSDDVQQTKEGFEQFVVRSGALWFEVIDLEANETVGIMYLGDFVPSFTEPRYLSASFHVSMWDSKIGSRLPVLTGAVRQAFKLFRLHRLEMQIPLFAGGAIRVAKKAGFVEEGVRRKARRYGGQWWNVLHLAILEDEVPNG
jgi:RimJ/RimL family protein N-acetyltransferase